MAGFSRTRRRRKTRSRRTNERDWVGSWITLCLDHVNDLREYNDIRYPMDQRDQGPCSALHTREEWAEPQLLPIRLDWRPQEPHRTLRWQTTGVPAYTRFLLATVALSSQTLLEHWLSDIAEKEDVYSQHSKILSTGSQCNRTTSSLSCSIMKWWSSRSSQ